MIWVGISLTEVCAAPGVIVPKFVAECERQRKIVCQIVSNCFTLSQTVASMPCQESRGIAK